MRARGAWTVLLALPVALYACSETTDGSAPEPSDSGVVETDAGSEPSDAGSSDVDLRDADVDAGLEDAAGDAELDAGPPAVRLIGRFDTTSTANPMTSWADAQIIARFTGTEVKVSFDDKIAYSNVGKTRWEVFIDGASTSILSLEKAATQYTLASGLAPGEHTVKLHRLNEPQVGTSHFLGFEFPDGMLLPPPFRATRRIEFLSDSAANGYGTEGNGPNCPFEASTQNSRKAFPALVGDDLGAEIYNLSVSGRGLYWNYTRSNTDVFEVLYPRVLPFTNPLWDFSEFVPQVVWIMLGGNDWSMPNAGDPAPTLAAFQAKYDDFVTIVRGKYPNAHIFCTVASSITNAYPAGYNAYTNLKAGASNVVDARSAAGDTKIYFFEFVRAVSGDLTGCHGHATPAKHRAMADEATTVIKSKTGW